MPLMGGSGKRTRRPGRGGGSAGHDGGNSAAQEPRGAGDAAVAGPAQPPWQRGAGALTGPGSAGEEIDA